MTRQLEQKQEQRVTARNNALVRALDYGIVGGLESQGIELLGIAIKHDAFNCLLTLKAYVGGEYMVAFIGSDTMINCFLKAESEAKNQTLHWRADKYKAG